MSDKSLREKIDWLVKQVKCLGQGSVSETDPVFTSSPSYTISNTDIYNWNTPKWDLNGNSITATDFIGTVNSFPFTFKVNNLFSGTIDNVNNNVGFGYRTGGYTNSISNVFLGTNTLFSNLGSIQNTAIGHSAGYSLKSGDNNIFIGAGSGFGIQNGDNNIIIGQNNNNFLLTSTYNNIMSIGNMSFMGTSVFTSLNNGGIVFGANNFSVLPSFVIDFGTNTLKLNEKLVLSSTTPNANGDITYTNYLVSKADGTVGTITANNIPNLYNINGTLVNSRIVTMNTNSLTYQSSATTQAVHIINALGLTTGTASHINYGTGNGIVLNGTGISISSPGTVPLKIISGTTGAVTLDSGTTGAINIGTNANAKVVTIGNTIGTSNTIVNTGTTGMNVNTPGTTVNGITLTNSTAGPTAHVRHRLVNNAGISADITVNSSTAVTDTNALVISTPGNVILRAASGNNEFKLTNVNTYVLNQLLSTTTLPPQAGTQKGRAIGVDTTGTLRRITNEAGQVRVNYTGLTLTNFASETAKTFNINGATPSLSASPTTTFPFSTPNSYLGIFDAARGTTPVVGRLIENPINGQSHVWRIQGTYTGKGAGNNGALDIVFRNPISGFSVTRSITLPLGRTSGSFDELIITIADSASIPTPNGYILEARTSFADANIVVGITSITRISNAVDN